MFQIFWTILSWWSLIWIIPGVFGNLGLLLGITVGVVCWVVWEGRTLVPVVGDHHFDALVLLQLYTNPAFVWSHCQHIIINPFGKSQFTTQSNSVNIPLFWYLMPPCRLGCYCRLTWAASGSGPHSSDAGRRPAVAAKFRRQSPFEIHHNWQVPGADTTVGSKHIYLWRNYRDISL